MTIAHENLGSLHRPLRVAYALDGIGDLDRPTDGTVDVEASYAGI